MLEYKQLVISLLSTELKNVMYKTSFYTEYEAPAPEIVKEDAYVAFAGPAVNLIITVLLTLALLVIPKNTPRKRFVALFLVLFLIPSILSVVINLIPVAGTDGSMIMQFLA